MENKLTLNEIGLKYKSDKSSSYHCYLEIYDNYFTKYRNTDINLLEIGILFGDSLQIFNEYFENAKITAIDIDDKSHLKKENIDIIRGDQSDRELLSNFNDEHFHIILDDGSHKMSHQQISIGVLFKKLKNGGIYVVEDLHTSLDEYRENMIYGSQLFGIEEGNRTIDFLNGIKGNKKSNVYLSDNEYSYLLENVESIEIFETSRKNDNEFSITSIIKKK
jgi:hypothetical protein